ncbi:MAG: hypothetical protein IRZ08_13260, partial [Frankia sp.]|nr:hypothetical protein [Frankia sp.]
IRTRAYRVVVHRDPGTFEGHSGALEWTVENGLVALQSHDFTAYFHDSVDLLRKKIPGDRSRGVSLTEIRHRSDSMPISELELGTSSRILHYSADPTTEDNVAEDTGLTALLEGLGTEVWVRKAGIAVTGKRIILCDFVTYTATCHGGAKATLVEFLRTLPVLRPLSKEQGLRLLDFLT